MANLDDLPAILRREDANALLDLARVKAGPVVRYVTGRLYSADQDEKWRAVHALGSIVRTPGLLSDERVLDVLHRFLWALNDESGAVPFGVPEAIGEILAWRPEYRGQIIPVLCGMLTEDETFQTGAVERGIYWALGRIGPDVLRHCADVTRVVSHAAACHPDPGTRAVAARTLVALTGP